MTDMQLSRRPVPPEVLEALKAVVGPSGFLDQASDTGPYCKSWRDDWQGRTALVLRPQSTEEVSRIVAICASAGVALVPQGGNTGLTGAGQPYRRSTAAGRDIEETHPVRHSRGSHWSMAGDGRSGGQGRGGEHAGHAARWVRQPPHPAAVQVVSGH